MAISETVRLIIEVKGGPEGVQIIRRLAREAERLDSAFSRSRTLGVELGRDVSGSVGLISTAIEGVPFDRLESGLLVPIDLAAQLGQQSEKTAAASERLTASRKRFQTQEQASAEVTKRSNLLLIDLGRGLQDLAFGVRAAVNNLDPLILNWARFREAAVAASGGTLTFIGTMRTLGSVLAGPAGILLIINLIFLLQSLTGVFDPLVEKIEGFVASLTGADKALDDFNKSVQEALKQEVTLDADVDLSQAISEFERLNEELERLRDIRQALTLGAAGGFLAELFGPAALGPVGGVTAIEGIFRSIFGEEDPDAALARVDAKIEKLDQTREAFFDVIRKFTVTAEIFRLGDTSVVGEFEEDIRKSLLESEENIRKIQEDLGERQTEDAVRIVRERTDKRVDELEKQYKTLERTLVESERELQESLEKARASGSESETDFAEQALQRFNVTAPKVRALLRSLNAEIESERRRGLEQEKKLLQEEIDAREEFNDKLVQIEFDTEEAILRSRRVTTLQKIDLVELETRRRIETLEQGLNREFENEADRAVFYQAVSEQVLAIYAQESFLKQQILDEDFERERAYNERILRLREDLSVSLRSRTEENVLRARLARLDEELQAEQTTEERKREIRAETLQLEIQLARTLDQQNKQRQKNEEELARLRSEVDKANIEASRESIERQIALENERIDEEARILRLRAAQFEGSEAQKEEFARLTNARLAQLEEERILKEAALRRKEAEEIREHEERLRRIREDEAVARGAVTEEQVHTARIARLREQVAVQIAGSEEQRKAIEALAKAEADLEELRRKNHEEEVKRRQKELEETARFVRQVLDISEQLQEVQGTPLLDILEQRRRRIETEIGFINTLGGDIQDAQLELLKTELEIAKEEERIFEQRLDVLRRYFQDVTEITIEELRRKRKLTDEDIESERLGFRQSEEELNRSFAQRRISIETFTIESKKLASDRAKFEKEVDQDRASFSSRLFKQLTDLAINEGARYLAAFIAQQVAQAVFGTTVMAATTATMTAAMGVIASAAGAAAGAVSIATFGAAAATGASAAIAAIAAVQAAAVSASKVGAAVAGFAEGGAVDDRSTTYSRLVSTKGRATGEGWTGPGAKYATAGVGLVEFHRGEYVLSQEVVQGEPALWDRIAIAVRRGLSLRELARYVELSREERRLATSTAMRAAPGEVSGIISRAEGGFISGYKVSEYTSEYASDFAQRTLRETLLSHILRQTAILEARYARLERSATRGSSEHKQATAALREIRTERERLTQSLRERIFASAYGSERSSERSKETSMISKDSAEVSVSLGRQIESFLGSFSEATTTLSERLGLYVTASQSSIFRSSHYDNIHDNTYGSHYHSRLAQEKVSTGHTLVLTSDHASEEATREVISEREHATSSLERHASMLAERTYSAERYREETLAERALERSLAERLASKAISEREAVAYAEHEHLSVERILAEAIAARSEITTAERLYSTALAETLSESQSSLSSSIQGFIRDAAHSKYVYNSDASSETDRALLEVSARSVIATIRALHEKEYSEPFPVSISSEILLESQERVRSILERAAHTAVHTAAQDLVREPGIQDIARTESGGERYEKLLAEKLATLIGFRAFELMRRDSFAHFTVPPIMPAAPAVLPMAGGGSVRRQAERYYERLLRERGRAVHAGYTGAGAPAMTAGVGLIEYHKGEYVVPADIVKGDAAAWDRLALVVRQGLSARVLVDYAETLGFGRPTSSGASPDQARRASSARSYQAGGMVAGRAVQGAGSVGFYQTGGFVASGLLLQPAPGIAQGASGAADLSGLMEQNKFILRELERIARTIREVEDREIYVEENSARRIRELADKQARVRQPTRRYTPRPK